MEVIDCKRCAKTVHFWDTDFYYSVAGFLMVSSHGPKGGNPPKHPYEVGAVVIPMT